MPELNYENEVNKLNEPKNWFKPRQGQTKIKIKEVGQDYEVEYSGKKVFKKLLTIEVDGLNYIWGITKGKTKASLYGQLMLAGKELGGLEGKTITLIVKNNGQKNDYTVLEAVSQTKTFEV